MKKNSLFFKWFAQAAKDASPEELETMAADAAAAMDEGAPQEPSGGGAAPASVQPPKEGAQDSTSLDQKMDMLMDMIKGLAEGKGGDPIEKPAENPLDSLVKELTGEDAEPLEPAAEAKVVPAEELDKSACAVDKAVMAAVVKQLRPVIAGIKDDATRKTVTDSLVSCLTDKDKVSDIAKIVQTTQKNAAKLADQKPQMNLDACQAAYDAMNPHKQNGGTK